MEPLAAPEIVEGCKIYSKWETRNEKFKTKTIKLEFDILEDVRAEPLGAQNAIVDLIKKLTEGLSSMFWISVCLFCPETVKYVNLPCVRISALTPELVFSAIDGAAQSAELFAEGNNFQMLLVTVADLEGKGKNTGLSQILRL
jgi:hypothetical protein